jgi:hypothetical protein
MANTVHRCTSPFVSRRQVLRASVAIVAGAALPQVLADAAGGVSIGMRAYTAIFP